MIGRLLSVCAAVLLVTGVAPLSGGPRTPWDVLPAGDAEAAGERELRVVTYNVAGLPDWLSSAVPSRDCGSVGRALAAYDLALLQEDFCHHEGIASAAPHPFVSRPSRGRLRFFGDGLGRFSRLPMGNRYRVSWRSCSGIAFGLSDCLARKGCCVAVHRLLGHRIYVVNLHLDAGRGEGDRAARRRQLAQLGEELRALPPEEPLLVAGDFNLCPEDPRDRALYEAFLGELALQDASFSLGREDGQIDRICFRSGARLELSVLETGTARGFADRAGNPFSDHPAIEARFFVRRR